MVTQNTLYTNDNLFVLHGLNSEIADLIYLDPPFNSKRMYSGVIGTKNAKVSFKDMWSWNDINNAYLEKLIIEHPFLVKFIQSIEGTHGKSMMAYITYMTQRIIEMHRILKPTGSIYLHCDPTASHYLKQLLDYIFGKNNCRNEIVWCYRGAGYPKKDFGKRHDIIFRYSKTNNYIFNLDDVRDDYAETTKERFKHHIGNIRNGIDFGLQELNPLGRHPDDWWEIQPIAPSAKERTGYPTQKPLKLLRKIIQASSNKGDLILDPFCGCATTCVASEELGRKWIGIDIEKKAVEVLIDRLSYDDRLFNNFTHRIDIPQRTDIQQENPNDKSVKERLFKQQNGHCNGCDIELEPRHFEVDHIIPKAKGGGDYFENYQLLCSSCNRIKGARPMEYLRMKINRIQIALQNKLTFGE